MHWLQTLDVELFRLINHRLSNSVLDVAMPWASGNPLFIPLVVLAGILLLWKGGARGAMCVLMLALIVPLGDGLVCNTIKHAVQRPRPFSALPDVLRPGTSQITLDMARLPPPEGMAAWPAGAGRDLNSMPSSHAANCFAATMILFIYYRRSLWFMLPAALVVGFSRIYNGVHYPSDVLAGAILGAGYAAGAVWSLDAFWRWAGRKWFPLWWQRLPCLLNPVVLPEPDGAEGSALHVTHELRTSGAAGGAFPLTPALSPSAGEREPGRPVPESTDALGLTKAQPTIPPLPRRGGEGRGEGEKPQQPQPATPVGTAPKEQAEPAPAASGARHATVDQHWLRLGYLWIALCLLGRLIYIASGTIQLAEDEAYQWVWSKHLALSYYSKPPLIAYTQFLGTHLWGDTAFGVRFFSPVIAALLSLLLLRFFAREVNARAGFFLLLIISAAPLMSVGAVLMTVDPLSVLFWTAAMLAGWRAVQPNAPTREWLWVGLWMGLGFLSKYTELLQLLCWGVFFALWPQARKHLRRPGPYLALLVNLLCALPVLIWNYQHQWITVSHVAGDAGLATAWTPSLKHLGEFLGAEAGLLNPVFFGATVWAAAAFWRRGRHDPRLVYFFSMGAPLFLVFLAYSLRSRILPNWIAPSVLPLFCLMVIYWDLKWRLGAAKLKPWLASGLGLGFALVILGHNTDLVKQMTGRLLPVNADPLHRVREWSEVARTVGAARQELLAEGKPVFIIAGNYGLTGEISFYLPEAKAAVTKEPLVFCLTSGPPSNQFFFWPGYQGHQGQNAIYVCELDRDRKFDPPAPPDLEQQFESVTLLGVRDVLYHGRVLRPLQIFACRGLK